MKPVWIKYYGLIPMTKRGYLIALGVTGGIVFWILLVLALLGTFPPLDTMWSRQNHRPGSDLGVWFHNYWYWFLVVCLIAQAIDTWCTLHAFAKKEAEQKAWREEEWDQSEPPAPLRYEPPDERIRPR
jgi:hypothetical protein